MKKLITLVESSRCQNFILLVILLNAVVLGLETSQSAMQKFGTLLHILDKIMLGIFVVELLLKFIAYRIRFFCNAWRSFDFAVVAVALIPAAGNLSVLRAFRVLRVFRVISVLPSLKKVITALITALPGLSSILIIMLVLYYVFSVMATKLFGAAFPEWFGDIGRSMFSLFQIMTLESWSMGIVRPVMQIYPYAWIFFVSYILLSTFMTLNLFIAVIVDAMQGAHNPTEQENADLAAELRQIKEELVHLRKNH